MMGVDPKSMGHVALVAGGDSAEREISLRGAQAVSEALDRLGVHYSQVDGARRLLEQVDAGHFDRVFNLLHGRGGEDGALQGALRLYGIPVTGSGVLASALTMSKVQTKRVWQATGLPTPEYRFIKKSECMSEAGVIDEQALSQKLAGLEGVMFVKPNREGSSVGMSRVESFEALVPALERAFALDDEVLIEQLIEGREFTVGILGETTLPVIELKTSREFYDFDAKYTASDTQYHCPADIPKALADELMSLAWQAFDVVGARGWGRVDVMVDQQQRPQLLEVNTTPGMTASSLLPKAAKAFGLSFEELVWQILSQAEIA